MHSEYSNIKLFYHTDRLEKILQGERCAPVYVRLKPTNICNQKCYYCFYSNENSLNVYQNRSVDRSMEIPWLKMQEIISDFHDMNIKAVTFTGGGEPLVYTYIVDAVKLLLKNNIDYALITNGQELYGEKAEVFENAKWVRISIESPNAALYKKIRGVDTYSRVICNIEDFSKKKNKSCSLGINCVINEYNFDIVYEMCRLAKESGVENIKFSPVNVGLDIVERNKNIKETVDQQLVYAMQDFNDDSFNIVNKYTNDIAQREDYTKPYKKCHIRNLFTVIGADMRVYNCIDKAYIPGGVLGDISNQSFKEMWYSEETKNKLLGYDIEKECNFRCIYEDRNKMLDEFLSLDENHVNFL